LLDEYAAEETTDYFTTESIDQPKDELSVDRIKASINSLQDPYRLVLNLVLIDGLDYEEISSITGEREGTIRTQYSIARKMLASKLTEIK
jgi:DNA-directed RNA polymerase specialized sigma24 family protein